MIAGTNRFVVASGKGAFNYSAIGNDYVRVGAAAKNSAILGGKDHSIDTLAENSGIFCGRHNTISVSPTQAPPMQTVIIGGENITATEPNTVYVPDLIAMGSITAESMNVTGQTVFDSLQVSQLIKVGNTINIGGSEVGSTNKIFDDSNDLLIQSETGSNYNTIINANNRGLVGIGTTEPSAKLNITGIVFEEDPKPLFRITENSGTIMLPSPPSANIFEIRKKTNAMTPDGQIVYSYALTVADTGSIGIGTNNPLQRLHVNSNSYFTGRVGIGINSNDPHLKLHVKGNSYFEGKVGIGTNSPQRTFHVHGDILISGHEGSIYFGNEDQEQYLDNGEWAIEFAPVYQGNQSGLNF